MYSRASLLPVREYTIMELVNVITDKPDWQRKVFDDEIVKKWRAEMLTPDEPRTEVGQAPTEADHDIEDTDDDSGSSAANVDDTEGSVGSASDSGSPARSANDSASSAWSADDGMPVDVSPRMVDWSIEETKYKAGVFEKSNCIEALDGVWKSDTAVAEDLKMALQAAVKPFEDVPDVSFSRSRTYSSSDPSIPILSPSLLWSTLSTLAHITYILNSETKIGIPDPMSKSLILCILLCIPWYTVKARSLHTINAEPMTAIHGSARAIRCHQLKISRRCW